MKLTDIDDQRILSLLSEVKDEAQRLFGDKLHQLILYGSYAKNQQERESDIDIMILVDESEEGLKAYRDGIADIMTDLSLKYDTFVSITKTTSKRFNEYLDVLPFYQSVNNEGIEIYGKKTA